MSSTVKVRTEDAAVEWGKRPGVRGGEETGGGEGQEFEKGGWRHRRRSDSPSLQARALPLFLSFSCCSFSDEVMHSSAVSVDNA